MRKVLLLLLALLVVPAWAAGEMAAPASGVPEAQGTTKAAQPAAKHKAKKKSKKKNKKSTAKPTTETSCPTGCSVQTCGPVTACFKRGCIAC